MKKQMMTALAVSAMMTLAMPFASFAASRSCQTGFRLWIHNWHQCLFYGPDAGRMRDFQWKCYWSLYVIREGISKLGDWK